MIGLFSEYLLHEDKSVFSLGLLSWIPVILAGALLIIRSIFFILKRYPGLLKIFKQTKVAAVPRKSIEQLRQEAYARLAGLEQWLVENPAAHEGAAKELSSICRDYIDQARLLRSKSMTLHEVQKSGGYAPEWLVEVMARCYEHEFNRKTTVPADQFPGVIAYARGQIGTWQ